MDMRKNLMGIILLLSFGLLLVSGCAKTPVKPDEGMAAPQAPKEAVSTEKKAPQQPAQQLATDQQLVTDQQLAAARQDEEARKRAEQQLESVKLPLKTIHFDFDSYVLSQTARDILYDNAEYLLKKYKGKVKLEGHCDERGSDEYNLALGENRAKAAMNYLITLGVPPEQLSIISYGKERPVDPASTEEAWAKNRRVEFVVNK
jgi:peptidoglycan-associated lipoprotein